MEFLRTNQRRQRGDENIVPDPESLSAKGLDVIVIGGGDTGCDCIGTSLRQGAKSITNFEFMPEMPTNRAPDNPWSTFPRTFKVGFTLYD